MKDFKNVENYVLGINLISKKTLKARAKQQNYKAKLIGFLNGCVAWRSSMCLRKIVYEPVGAGSSKTLKTSKYYLT